MIWHSRSLKYEFKLLKVLGDDLGLNSNLARDLDEVNCCKDDEMLQRDAKNVKFESLMVGCKVFPILSEVFTEKRGLTFLV